MSLTESGIGIVPTPDTPSWGWGGGGWVEGMQFAIWIPGDGLVEAVGCNPHYQCDDPILTPALTPSPLPITRAHYQCEDPIVRKV